MIRATSASLILAALLAAGAGGYWAGHLGLALSVHAPFLSLRAPERVAAVPTGPILYYRDPDGPNYSAGPKTNSRGKPFNPVLASEEASLEPATPRREARNAAQRSGNNEPRKVRFYRNPMGLPDTSPIPKKDSMGMDYIPVYEGEEDEIGIVKLSAGKVQRSGVRSVPAARQTLSQIIRAPGIVTLDERLITVLSARVDTFVEQVNAVTTGEPVKRNQPLVTLFSTEFAAAAAQFVAELKTDARGATIGGARKRLENLGVPPEEILEIERTRKVPPNMVWRAPRDGIVIERNVVTGMKMSAGTTLFRIADISKIWVLADIPERDLASLRLGGEVTIRIRHRPDLRLSGRISLIYPQVNMETRAARVRIELPNLGAALLPNMFVEVELETGGEGKHIVVPESAVIDSGTRKVVILDRDEGRFEPREVKTGFRGSGLIAILDGLAEGDRVVIAANFLIDAESNLKAALQSFMTPNELSNPKQQP